MTKTYSDWIGVCCFFDHHDSYIHHDLNIPTEVGPNFGPMPDDLFFFDFYEESITYISRRRKTKLRRKEFEMDQQQADIQELRKRAEHIRTGEGISSQGLERGSIYHLSPAEQIAAHQGVILSVIAQELARIASSLGRIEYYQKIAAGIIEPTGVSQPNE